MDRDTVIAVHLQLLHLCWSYHARPFGGTKTLIAGLASHLLGDAIRADQAIYQGCQQRGEDEYPQRTIRMLF